MQGNINSQSGGSSTGLNVFTQLQEPSKKEGIWIKTEETLTDKLDYTQLTDIPYNFANGDTVAIGTDIYLFGHVSSSDGTTSAYKYNILTGMYTQLTSIPYTFSKSSAVAIGTDIYLLGSSGGSREYNNYKYDTLTDTYTKLTNIPFPFYDGSAVAIGTNIYLFGSSSNSSTYKTAYKYNILTDTYAKLTDIPYNFYNGSAVAIENDIYLLGGIGPTLNLKYSALNDTYTRLTDIPYNFYEGSAVAIGTDVYLFGGSGNKKPAYKYNTLIDTYTNLTDIPYEFYNGSAVAIEKDIYLIGGSGNSTNNYKVQIISFPEISKYKYDNVNIIKDFEASSESLSTSEFNLSSAIAALVNKKVYLFIGLSSGYCQINLYDILKDKYTDSIHIISEQLQVSDATSIETNIYLSGRVKISSSTYKYYLYRYDTLTNTETKLAEIPYNFVNGGITSIGTDVYLFGGTESSKISYKYDTLTNTYTKLADIPYNLINGGITSIGTDVYLFGGTESLKIAYKYDTITNTYTKLADMPYNSYNSKPVAIFDRIFLELNKYIYEFNTVLNAYSQILSIGTSINKATILYDNTIYCFGLSSNGLQAMCYEMVVLKNKSINVKINHPISKNIRLLKNFLISVNIAKIYDDNELKEYPCYYGDGTKWNLIEN